MNEVYQAAEDSWALCDAIAEDLSTNAWKGPPPRICVEVGSGSGFVTNALYETVSKRWGKSCCVCFGTDINAQASKQTSHFDNRGNNGSIIETITTDLANPLLNRLHGKVDVLIFNPPYVPTELEELNQSQRPNRNNSSSGSISNSEGFGIISAAWAGGPNGISVLERFIPSIPKLLAQNGRFYLVAIAQNGPKALSERFLKLGLAPKLLLTRQAGEEHLFILRFSKYKLIPK